MSDLKPCPFCGCEAEIKHYGGNKYRVQCGNPIGCRVWPVTLRGETEQEAVDMWNTLRNSGCGWWEDSTCRKPEAEQHALERTCENLEYEKGFWCSECGAYVKNEVGESIINCGTRWYGTSNNHNWNYCPNCGAKVVKV